MSKTVQNLFSIEPKSGACYLGMRLYLQNSNDTAILWKILQYIFSEWFYISGLMLGNILEE
jgi:hypothetical protein